MNLYVILVKSISLIVLPIYDGVGKGGANMKADVIDALYRYFETLYELNQSLIVLCGIDATDRWLYQKRLESVIQAIPRLVPYRFNQATMHYELEINSGLLKFSDDIRYLRSDYLAILQQHGDFLERAKKIRNKLEHEMHNASIVTSLSGTYILFEITYEISGKKIRLTAEEMISFTKDLNVLFSKIQKDVETISDGYSERHLYIQKLNRFIFTDFNKIYESNLLRTFGKALLPF